MAKFNRFGQSALLAKKEYSKIRAKLNDRQKMLFDLAWFTGERWGAIVQLQVCDVFDERGNPKSEITFRANTRKASPNGKRSTRQVPMHPLLAEILRSHDVPRIGWLFPSRLNPAKHMTRRGASGWFDAAVAKSGLTEKGISTHSTRRTFITQLSNAGIDLRTIQEITGHKDLRTLQRYIEVSPDRIKSAIASLE